jgi:putative membrane protein
MKGPLIALAILTGGPALPQALAQSGHRHGDAAATAPRPSTLLSPRDRRFIQTAAANNLAQIALGQVAVQQGKTQRLRDFGQKMVDDHAKADDRLKQIASRAGVSLSTEPTDEQKATEDRLWATFEHEFDRAYLEQVKRSQRQAISAFRDEARHGRDRALKSFAKSMLPTLQQQKSLASRPSHKM